MRGYSGTTMTTPEEFWARVDCTGDGCWLWPCPDSHAEYGHAPWQGRGQPAHVVAYKLSGQIVYPGMEVHHICENKRCVRPSHLQALTKSEHSTLHHKARKHRWQIVLHRDATVEKPASHFGQVGFTGKGKAMYAARQWQKLYPDHTRIVVSHYPVDGNGNRLPAPGTRRLKIVAA